MQELIFNKLCNKDIIFAETFLWNQRGDIYIIFNGKGILTSLNNLKQVKQYLTEKYGQGNNQLIIKIDSIYLKSKL